jgi:predicted nicotinamide N-methyase
VTQSAGERETASKIELLEDEFTFGEIHLHLRRPADPAALVSETAFAENEFLPYWAEIWPSALRLAEALPEALAGISLLELGCGLGLPSLVAAARGASVLATDWSEEAIALLTENAASNDLELTARRVDWAEPALLLEAAPFDLVIAADVLYEVRNVEWLAALLPRLGVEVLLADPGRDHATTFFTRLVADYQRDELEGGVHRLTRR